MGLFKEIRAKARYVVGSVLAVFIVVYLVYHVISGDRGLIAWWRLSQEAVVTQAKVKITEAQRRTLERRVRLLHPGSLDRDMLEERARVMLNYGHAEDIVILENEGNK